MAYMRASLLEREGAWDPQFFCGPIAPLLNGTITQTLHRTKAQVIEGWRGIASGHAQEHRNVEPQPLYRMSNVGELELRLGPEHCLPPARSDLHCVRPGDVVVTKRVPVRAAIAASQIFRHRADANHYVIRGLNQADGFWVALCLNQPAYAKYLTRKSGAAIMPRVRMAVLREAPFPAQPVGVAALSHRVLDCLDGRIESMAELFRFVASVHDYIATLLPESGDNPVEFHHNGSAWHRFFPPPDIDDSLVPTHVAVNGYKLRSTVRQLNPVSAGSTHPRVSRDDVLGVFIPWLRDPISAGNLLRWAQRDYFAAEKLITAARLLVEALIDGRLSEDDLRAAEQEWEQGNRELDRAILSRITISGVDTEGAPPLFTDLNALYATIDEAERAHAPGETA
jgi:hypothetical protein